MPHRIVIGLFIPFVVYVVFLIVDWIDIILHSRLQRTWHGYMLQG